ncbi:hypothetical protein, conserved [Cyanidioschyzon merolae strain 10D]|jgi:hypothetical protein|uniref:GCK domain-containing protein n=1 Tax=Cyanidioschyzon merolae (strain NIES-3377 / 10D) TaxID=280699 RepID=M1VHK7_CYAM1|nr:hypothetical protein, conserved [Cyanidioschyzon merolae strain 10D]BAM80388.1 hypothetical protein, conserved [Cyanidioschyzon merolae strain 10D]|eukprot:XP_005534995.1 hypothetical protein, conserved [Cyanidioschyzon merolae strain 10D]
MQPDKEVRGTEAVDAASSSPSRDNRSKEQMIEDALNCPCVESLKEGSCGGAFIAAYRCFLESEAEPRGSDCYEVFQRMQDCMLAHPDEYHFDDREEEEAELERRSSSVENGRSVVVNPEPLPAPASAPPSTGRDPSESLEGARTRAVVAAASSTEDGQSKPEQGARSR